MEIVQPSAKIDDEWFDMDMPDPGIMLLRKIERIARVSHRSEDRMTYESWRPFLTTVIMKKGDWSVTEHASVTVTLVVDRGITHELVRHRIGAYTQESTRFVNYEKKMAPNFIAPFPLPTGNPEDTHESDTWNVWEAAIEACETGYKELIKLGHAPQIARSLFPNALASKIVVTYNLRNWRHFFLMRTTREAHPQMRQVTIPLLEEFQEKIPLLYDDIRPHQTQEYNLSKAR